MRVEESLLTQVQGIAKKRGVTLTHLVDQHFRSLVHEETAPKSDEELGVDQA
jgi:hypothetical protein